MGREVCKWDGEIEGYTKRLILKFGYRLAVLYDFDDLVQEAFLIFMAARDRYGHKMCSAKQFQALYKTILRSRMLNMQRFVNKRRNVCHLGRDARKIIQPEDDLRCLDVCDAGDEIGRILVRLEILDRWHGRRFLKKRRGPRETPEAFVRRMAGPRAWPQLLKWLGKESMCHVGAES